MIRMKPVGNGVRGERAARRADLYYEKSDAGYYRGEGGSRSEWLGKGAEALGLAGEPEYEHFKRLIRGLDPHTGEQLTAKLIEDRIPAWDVTASVPKGVTIAKLRGDERVPGIIWEANRLALAELERYATTRVRLDGRQEDRVTGNLAIYSVSHGETRPVLDESLPQDHPWRIMPMPDDHIHNVVANVTLDAVEDKWKAVKFRPIMDLRKYFDRYFDHWLSHLLAEAGYEIETKWRDGKYYSWDIKGMPVHLVERLSGRSREVEEAEAAIIAERKEAARLAGDPGWELIPDRLSAVERDKLGATSRRHKRDDLTFEECQAYWDTLFSAADAAAVAELIDRARSGRNPRPARTVGEAVRFAYLHHSERESCMRWEELAATAMERCMGHASPPEIEAEAVRQGMILGVLGGERFATSPELRAEERYLAEAALLGRGDVTPVAVPAGLTRTTDDGKVLNDGQWRAALGLLKSENRINLLEGPAGAGKSSLLAKYEEAMRRAGHAVAYLGTTAKSVGVLKRDGFAADTLARFLIDGAMQASARGRRVVIDEASMMGHRDAVRLFELAQRLDLKLILVGDAAQHGSVGRGSTMRLLEEFGGIRPFLVPEILRQREAEDERYLLAATQLSEGKAEEGFATLDAMGAVREVADDTDRYRHIAADYLQARDDRKSCLIVSPTHAEAARITAMLRHELKAAGRLSRGEHAVTRLVARDASEAERGDIRSYHKGDVLVFHKHAKGYRRGERVRVDDPASVPVGQADRFDVYRPETLLLARGDLIRFTGTVKTMDGKHTLKNGMTRTLGEITPGGNLRLENGWVIPSDAGFIRHGYVETSMGSQGSTVQRAIVAANSQSGRAANREMEYVTATRAKERVTFYTDDKDFLRDAITRSSHKRLALDLPEPRRPQIGRPDGRASRGERKRRLTLTQLARSAYGGQARPNDKQHREERQADHGYGR
ncbi:MobF family relaxase [Singulisphaera sp. PoT]|uniref:MobF family relaxase n=1 Tax=Singulisphaera sp. PoT TaxID=3411797 RepID=UPI003BF4ABD5